MLKVSLIIFNKSFLLLKYLYLKKILQIIIIIKLNINYFSVTYVKYFYRFYTQVNLKRFKNNHGFDSTNLFLFTIYCYFLLLFDI